MVQDSRAAPPETIYWEGDRLVAVREGRLKSEEVSLALNELKRQAASAKRRGAYSVVQGSSVPPSGDPHDYVSYGRYWWPNSKSPDGLPYVRKDGLVNRDLVEEGDREVLACFCRDVERLSLSAYLHKDGEARERAVDLLRRWYLDAQSKMTPRVEYGQIVPGHATGRPEGILDTRAFLPVIDAIILLEADGLYEEDSLALRRWFEIYADWLASSPLASRARRKRNNHGSWLAAQEASVALFLGRDDVARDIVERVRDQRIADSIAPDGEQPFEVERTRSLMYSIFNLEGLIHIARVGDRVGVDLWSHTASNGASLEKAFDYVAASLSGERSWPHENLHSFQMNEESAAVFRLAGQRLHYPILHDLQLQLHPKEAGPSLAPLLFASGDDRSDDRGQ